MSMQTLHHGKEKFNDKSRLKKEERTCSKLTLAGTKEKGQRKSQKKTRSWGKSVRTGFHVRHFPDVPCGEITIEVTSSVKHCTTQQQRKFQG